MCTSTKPHHLQAPDARHVRPSNTQQGDDDDVLILVCNHHDDDDGDDDDNDNDYDDDDDVQFSPRWLTDEDPWAWVQQAFSPCVPNISA